MTWSGEGLKNLSSWPDLNLIRRRCRLLRKDAAGGRLVRLLLAALRLGLRPRRLQIGMRRLVRRDRDQLDRRARLFRRSVCGMRATLPQFGVGRSLHTTISGSRSHRARPD